MTRRKEFSESADDFLETEVLGDRVTQAGDTLSMIVYGRAGVGKTVFGATLPQPLILAPESGWQSIRDKLGQVTVIDVQKYDDVLLAVELLRRDAGKRWKSIVIDSLTEAQRLHMDALLDETGKPTPSIDMWGDNTMEIRRLVREVVALPGIHKLFIAGVRDDKDEQTGAYMKKPGLTGKMSDEVEHFVDIVGYYGVSEKKPDKPGQPSGISRWILVEPQTKITAKDRWGALPKYVKPNFTEFLAAIFSSEQTPETGTEKKADPKPETADGEMDLSGLDETPLATK